MSVSYTKNKEVILTQEQFNARLQAGTLQEGVVYKIKGEAQPLIDSTHKVNADLIDDSASTNKFVTSSEKTDITNNTSARHTHSNKALLDDISSEDISNWDSKADLSDIPDVIDNVTSTSTEDALSANQGKVLQTEINNLKNIGRFLAIWDASTGAPTSEPSESPYTYKVGDYYRVGVEGIKNPAPNLTYITGGTNYVEGGSLGVGDVIYCSNVTSTATTWVRQASSGGGTVQDVQVGGVSVLSSGVANIPLGTGIQYTNNALGVVVNANFGTGVVASGLFISCATNAQIEEKSQNFKPIVPSNLDVAIREGLGNNTLTWSDAYKQSARNTIGATDTKVTIKEW